MLHREHGPPWLTTDWLLSQFSAGRRDAIKKYVRFVKAGIKQPSIWGQLNRQIYLGNDDFVERMLAMDEKSGEALNVPKVQKCRPAASLEDLDSRYPNRNEAIVAAYATGQYSYHQIARHYGLHYTSVGKIVRSRRG